MASYLDIVSDHARVPVLGGSIITRRIKNMANPIYIHTNYGHIAHRWEDCVINILLLYSLLNVSKSFQALAIQLAAHNVGG